jgi:aryl-alcohol dehydrogenase-like predicted oxidoreductase
MMKALGISRQEHLARFVSTQSYYSLAGRELEREIIPCITDQKLGLLVWSPLAGGFLSGKFTRASRDEAARRATFDFPPVNKEKAYDIIDAMQPIAAAHGTSVAQVALAWILAQPSVTTVIIGARKMTQLEDNLKSVELTLTPEELGTLDAVSRPSPEYPAWMQGALTDDRYPGQERRFSATPKAQGAS